MRFGILGAEVVNIGGQNKDKAFSNNFPFDVLPNFQPPPPPPPQIIYVTPNRNQLIPQLNLIQHPNPNNMLNIPIQPSQNKQNIITKPAQNIGKIPIPTISPPVNNL